MIGRPESRVRQWQDRALVRFDLWFTSASCVWQTLVFCGIIVVIEMVRPDLDPHFFFLLMILTVYSAITQPALAQSSAATAKKLETIMERQQKVMDALLLLQKEQAEELEETSEILEDVHEILRRQEP